MKLYYAIITFVALQTSVCSAAEKCTILLSPIKQGCEQAILSDFNADDTFVICLAIHQVLQEKERAIMSKIAHAKVAKNRHQKTKRERRLQLLAYDLADFFNTLNEENTHISKRARAAELQLIAADIRAYEQENGDL